MSSKRKCYVFFFRFVKTYILLDDWHLALQVHQTFFKSFQIDCVYWNTGLTARKMFCNKEKESGSKKETVQNNKDTMQFGHNCKHNYDVIWDVFLTVLCVFGTGIFLQNYLLPIFSILLYVYLWNKIYVFNLIWYCVCILVYMKYV